MDYMSVDAAGLAGGILYIWKPSVFSLSKCCCSRNFILLSGTILPVFTFMLINIYAPNDGKEKWCIRVDRGMRAFNEFIEDLELFDLPMQGWSGLVSKTISFFECLDFASAVSINGEEVLGGGWYIRPKLLGYFNSIGHDGAIDGLEAEFSEEEVWIFKADVLQFFKEFYDNEKLAGGVNSSFIILIPKVDGPATISDYRPISLIGSLYKILAKVLTSRLKLMVPRVIGEAQSAFLGGRNIMDGVLIANEVVAWWKNNRAKGLILKLDFKKVFDSVNWECLMSMLTVFGFGAQWRKWIKECLHSSRISVLVNGSPTAEFVLEKGLRQGDPLSFFLFNVVAEELNVLLQRALSSVLIKGLVFGLKINFSKSLVSGIGVPDQLVEEFVNRLHCKSKRLPFPYLGLPLGANPRLRKTWRLVVDKMPTYVVKVVEGLQASFLWGGSDLKKKIHLVKWAEVSKSKDQGQCSCSSLYHLLLSSGSMGVSKMLWSNVSPQKVQFLGWLSWKRKLKTLVFLNRIGVLGHNVLGLQWIVPATVESLFLWWSGFKWRTLENKIWRAMPLAIMWSIWRFRNEVVFNGQEAVLGEICELIKLRIIFWVTAHTMGCSYTVQDFMSNLQQITYGV
ncbi:uncharacterized protein LOC114310805 [Camellia sinensis]|uniref:uncharacterized protein LOC114310805 n=1 Tax=Camellia sinensis TaxID=4442 RepID=UPI001036E6F7|nr:uncharacterized protein LOC114310805 [Camellia sinensis]